MRDMAIRMVSNEEFLDRLEKIKREPDVADIIRMQEISQKAMQQYYESVKCHRPPVVTSSRSW